MQRRRAPAHCCCSTVFQPSGVNGAALWALATSPSTPKGAQIHTTPPVNFSGTNFTTLSWNANPEISKDNVQFAVRAVDQEGNRSPVAFPQAVA
jgi:hypothetical protein